MNESETRAEHIDPALTAGGWGVVPGSRVRREYGITLGRLEGQGRRAKAKQADYILIHQNHNLGVLEAKAWDRPLTEGIAQAKDYAERLQLRFAFSSNGQGFYRVDMQTGEEGPLPAIPGPEELWNAVYQVPNEWRDRLAAIPFESVGGKFGLRYYQELAVDRVLEAIAFDRERILLTLATGTGKTFIAFQIAWKLFQSKWNLSRQPTRRPRILFLADRNILANQAFNDFSAFPDDSLARITPEDIRKKGRVPKNANLFFTIFQTFMTERGTTESGKTERGTTLPVMDSAVAAGTPHQPAYNFGEYPPDFFDFIVIDECHRGGAQDESNWRGILEYFAPAVQLGLTATPKRRDNVDTYKYFGEPVYVYSLKDGINDGFLTPFKVRQISTTMDEYVYTPDDELLEGEIVQGKRYEERDFNRSIVIEDRERKRVDILMSSIDQREKTLVFCATQDHALLIRDYINQVKKSSDPSYCQRVTAADGALGEQHLRAFQDNDKTIPTILTTSQKLSTGVDARNVRNIVLLRPINSMIEFKQIIGRGTRLYDGKDYFTIYDFVKAHQHFSDPEWDGEPVDPIPPKPPKDGPTGEPPVPEPEPDPEPPAPRTKVRIKLSDGKARNIQHMTSTSFWHTDGTPMSSQQFLEMLFGKLPGFFKDEEELRAIWSVPDTRRQLLEGLAEKGFGAEQMREMQRIIDAENSDLYDVLAYVAYALPPMTREARADRAKTVINQQFTYKQMEFLNFVLGQYVQIGVEELDLGKLSPLLKLKYHNSLGDAVRELGEPAKIQTAFRDFQKYLYQPSLGHSSC